jgi:CheY-like chemotaxis protein/HPt (histidine-containing phosphotransfer) domain-containing protein/anti-sigma regulatory factor (Ser/Thr protein kinase)
LDTARTSAKTLLGILNDLLDFSKIEAGGLRLNEVSFNLEELIEDVIEIFAKEAQAKSIKLFSKFDYNGHHSVLGDPGRLQQIIINLLTNAIKFTEKGEVSLQATEINNDTDKVVWLFEVEDTGIGISSQALPYIFETFYQVDGSSRRKYGGAGLGLAIVKQIVELMGGEVGVDSVPDKGSKFWFTVPFQKAPFHQGNLQFYESDLPGATILIASDDSANLLALHHQVSSWGMPNVTAKDESQALEILKEASRRGKPYNVAILDLENSALGPLEVTKVFREEPSIDHLSLVVLTSAIPDEFSQSTGEDNLSFLAKPWRKSQLFNSLVTLLKAKKKKDADWEGDLAKGEFQGSGHVLIAEDNLVNQEVARGFLEKLGYRVTLVSNGKEALDISARQPFDLIFMDCQMPVMDGYEAVKAIRAREASASQGAHIPIIAMTAHALEGDRERCLAAGMDDYIGKPFSVEQLKSILHQWISLRAESGLTRLPVSSEKYGEEPRKEMPPGAPLVAETPLSSAIDRKIIEQIKSLTTDGEPDLLGRILTTYLSETQKLLDKLIEDFKQADAEAVKKTAHSLKSSSAHVGAVKLSSLFKEIEAKAKERSLDDINEMVAALTQEFDLVQQALNLELQKVLS